MAPTTPATPLIVHDLGRLSYQAALHRQMQMHEQVVVGRVEPPGVLLLVEHDPVITIGPRSNAQHLLASAGQLGELGIDVQPTNRGGQITYHGPGQLVVYPILHLGSLGFNVARYITWLEQVVIQTVAKFCIEAQRASCTRGVWTARPPAAKLAAVGVRIKRNVALHGVALNVTTNLEHFKTIIPCGRRDTAVTSMHQLLGEHCPTMQQVKNALVEIVQMSLTKQLQPA